MTATTPTSVSATRDGARRLSTWLGRLGGRSQAARQALLDTDPLTGLPNRAASLAQAMALHVRAGQLAAPRPMGLLLAELDDTAGLVQRHGAAVGEQAVREVSMALRRGIRQGDLIGRWAAGAFIIVLPPTDPAALRMIGERLRAQALARELRAGTAGELVPLQLHIGAAALPTDGAIDLALQRAEQALEMASPRGRGERVSVIES